MVMMKPVGYNGNVVMVMVMIVMVITVADWQLCDGVGGNGE
jgi:hypothetical protein